MQNILLTTLNKKRRYKATAGTNRIGFQLTNMNVGVHKNNFYYIGGNLQGGAYYNIAAVKTTNTEEAPYVGAMLPQGIGWNGGDGAQKGNMLYMHNFMNPGWSNIVYSYNMDTNALSAIGASPYPNRHSSANIVVGDELYIFAGFLQSPAKTTNTCHKFNLTTGAWTALPLMPYGGNGLKAHYYRGKIYIPFGFTDILGRNLAGIQIYNIATNSWTYENYGGNTMAISWGSSAIVDNTIFYIGWSPLSNSIASMVTMNLDFKTIVARTLPGVPILFGSSLVYDPALKRLSLIGGVIYDPGQSGLYNSTPRSNVSYVFDVTPD